MKDYRFYNRAIELDEKNAGKYYAGRAVLYFYDMDYELAWNDFQKASELGEFVIDKNEYKMLAGYKKIEESGQTDLSQLEPLNTGEFYNYVNYFLIKKDYEQLFSLIANFVKTHKKYRIEDFSDVLKTISFYMQKNYIINKVKENPNSEKAYVDRIRFYQETLENPDIDNEEFYKQRIIRDFEKLEELSKTTEYVYLVISQYYENIDNLGNAVKYCQKALETAKKNKNNVLIFIISTVLKGLYSKDGNLEKAKEIAMTLVETTSSPEEIGKEVYNFYNKNPLFPLLRFPFEITKYRRNLFKISKPSKKAIIGKHENGIYLYNLRY